MKLKLLTSLNLIVFIYIKYEYHSLIWQMKVLEAHNKLKKIQTELNSMPFGKWKVL